MRRRWAIPLVFAVFGFGPSCGDPVHNAQVDALGPETGGGPGPTHRAGQPCLTCHGGQGPADVEFAVAGTVYQLPDAGAPGYEGVVVAVFDATQDADGGTPKTARTNTVGNFYIRSADWSPVFPLHDVTLGVDGSQFQPVMKTRVGRDGSCGTCHFDPAGTGSPGHVYFASEPGDLPGGGQP